MNISTYGVNYAASKLQMHGGDGANDVISHVKSMASSCPNTKIVLGGYSQGAAVMDIVSRRAHRRHQLGQFAAAGVREQRCRRRRLRRRGRPRRRIAAPPRAPCSVPRRSTCATPTTRSATRVRATSGVDTPRATSPCTPPRRRLSSRPSCWPDPISRYPVSGRRSRCPARRSPGYNGPELPGPQQAPGPGTSIHQFDPARPGFGRGVPLTHCR